MQLIEAPCGLIPNRVCTRGKRLYFKNHHPCCAQSIHHALKEGCTNTFSLGLLPHGQPENVGDMWRFPAGYQKAFYRLIDLSNKSAKAAKVRWQQLIDDFLCKIMWQ